MRHRKVIKTLNRVSAARKALMRDLATSVVVYEKVVMTQTKAKAVRPEIEHLITIAKKNDLAARRRLLSYFTTEQPVNKLMEVIAPRLKDRQGGYVRITKLGRRVGDAAPTVQIELL
ncbi:MAG: 50S ribosomal protein L17 [Patescibacteria group bacterium]|jgi:large subunit ribosomal protein L17